VNFWPKRYVFKDGFWEGVGFLEYHANPAAKVVNVSAVGTVNVLSVNKYIA
jgi:hypothetical protein